MFGIKVFLAAFTYGEVAVRNCCGSENDYTQGFLGTDSTNRAYVSALEDHLVKIAGWKAPDNKVAFLWLGDDGIMNLVRFHDDKFTHLKWMAGKYGWGRTLPSNIVRGDDLVLAAVYNYLKSIGQ